MRVLAVAGEIVVGLVFVRAAFPKLMHPNRFSAQVIAYGMLPRPASRAIAPVIVASEVCVAVLVLFGAANESTVGLFIGAAASCLFLVVTIWEIRRGRDIACGCFGAEERVSGRSILRLFLLLGLIASLLALAVADGPLPSVATFLLDGGPRALATALVASAILGLGKSGLALYDVVMMSSSLGPTGSRPAQRRGDEGGG